MKAAPFRYLPAGSVEEAVGALAELGDEAKVLAGGQSLLALMNLRLAQPEALIEIGRCGLSGIASTMPCGSARRRPRTPRSGRQRSRRALRC
jgi:CO/xanthine dehydrogenase FAD-binding subunit